MAKVQIKPANTFPDLVHSIFTFDLHANVCFHTTFLANFDNL